MLIDHNGYILHLFAGLCVSLIFRKEKALQVALLIALSKEMFDSYAGGTTDVLDVLFTVYIPYLYQNKNN